MQIIGEEQIFQMLFSELRIDDEQIAPRFSVVWNCAQTRTKAKPNVKLSFVVATAIFAACLLSFAAWLGIRTDATLQSAAIVVPYSSRIGSVPRQETNSATVQVLPKRVSHRAISRRGVLKLNERQNEKSPWFLESEIWNAVPLLSWQSPTAMLMQSPAADVLSSLPHLYQSVTDFHSFLPNMQE